MRDLWTTRFFSRGDVSPTHSELCRFVSGSWAKDQVPSPVVILLKRILFHIGHRDNVLAGCYSIFPLLRCQGVWNKTCTQLSLSQILFQNRITTVLGIFKGYAIILDANRLSFFSKSATAAVFTSVPVDFGWPHLSSPSTSSLLSRNREYHPKTFDGFRSSFP
jgi:hypothetical protein